MGVTESSAEPRLLTTQQLAARLQVHPKTVSRWARENQFPYVTMPGGDRRFRLDEVIEALNKARSFS